VILIEDHDLYKLKPRLRASTSQHIITMNPLLQKTQRWNKIKFKAHFKFQGLFKAHIHSHCRS